MNFLEKINFQIVSFWGLLLIGCFMISCQKEDIKPIESDLSFLGEGDPMVLGDQLENPYSVQNMKRALNVIQSGGRLSENVLIETTDLYVRFQPRDSSELNALESDSTLNLYDYPLDFEIDQVGHWYHDPTIPDHLPTYQYTVVKPGYIFPDTISHEVLADLFLIEDLIEEAASSRRDGYIETLLALEDEALRITNNWEPRIDMSSSRWNPKGKVEVQERVGGITRSTYLPVKGIRVRARRWFTIKTDYTNSVGDYRISSFVNRPVNYSLVFRTPRFRVAGWTGHANRYNGPKKESSWNPKFNWHSDWWVRATVINAMYDFRKQAETYSLKLPSTAVPARVRVVFKEGRSSATRGWVRHYIPFAGAFVRNDVKLYSKFQGGTNLETDDLYELTMHELAHISHLLKSPINSALSLGIVNESFATAVEYEFTRKYYPTLVNDLPDQSRSVIECCSDYSYQYTPYFIDLMDNTNQRILRGGLTEYASDRVSGYTLSQFQNALDRRTTLHGVKAYLRDNYSNQSGLNELTDFYQDIKDDN